MQYKFKVEVYKRNPYNGWFWFLALIVGLPVAFFLLQKVDRLSWISPAIAAPTQIRIQPSEMKIPHPASATTMSTSANLTLASYARQRLMENTMVARRRSRKIRTGTCVLEGKALYQGSPLPDTLVLARVSTTNGARVRKTKTTANGSYRLEVPVTARITDSVDWSIEARTVELKNIVLAGRKIFLGDPVVAIDQSLNF